MNDDARLPSTPDGVTAGSPSTVGDADALERAATRGAVAVSVVIVTYNCRDLTRDCLDSLIGGLRELAPATAEVLVVDNGSTDGTIELVQSHPVGARLVDAGGNVGFAAANNRAFDVARGELILLLNPDTVVRPGALRGAVAEMARRPDVGMLGVKLVLPDGTLDHACKRGFPTPGASLAYFTRLDRILPPDHRLAAYRTAAGRPDEAEYVDAISGAFMLVRRSALADVGPLDEQYWMYSEDLDWCSRFHRAGWRVFYWPGGEVLHVKGGSGGHRGLKANVAFHTGMIRFHRLHGGGSRLGHLAVAAAVWVRLGLSLARSAAAQLPTRARRWRRVSHDV